MSDSRTKRLVNNLNLRLVAPPSVPGTWQAIVSFSGALVNNLQNYSLLISGSGYFPPAPISVTSDFAVEGIVALSITGTAFRDGVAVELVRASNPTAQAAVTNVSWTNMVCSLDVTSMEQGEWSVRVINSDDQVGELTNAFAVVRMFANEPFEPTPSTWSASATIGSSYWTVTSAASHTPSNSYTASGPATRNTDNLLSLKIVIPTSADRKRRLHLNDSGARRLNSKPRGTCRLASMDWQ